MINFVKRKVYLLAHSRPTREEDLPHPEWFYDFGDAVEDRILRENQTEADDRFSERPDGVMEFAGRLCYDAFERKTEKTRENKDYIANILDQNHGSVLEHSSFTFLLANVSRAATHEIVRHRHFSFSQESQRFVHGRKRDVVVPEKVLNSGIEFDDEAISTLSAAFDNNEKAYDDLRTLDFSHKEAAEAARCFLPNAAATNIAVTGNARSWKEFIEKRIAPGADAELQGIARDVLDILEVVNPSVFSEEARAHWDGSEVQNGPKA